MRSSATSARDRLLRMPRLAAVARPRDGRRDRRPTGRAARPARRSRRRAGRRHACSAASGNARPVRPCPQHVGDVAVVHRVLGLHARRSPRGAANRAMSAVGDQLGVLDAAADADAARRRRARAGWRVADGVHGGLEPVSRRRTASLRTSSCGRQVRDAVAAVRVGVEAEGGAGVERAVGDDLERADGEQAVGARDRRRPCAGRASAARSRWSP